MNDGLSCCIFRAPFHAHRAHGLAIAGAASSGAAAWWLNDEADAELIRRATAEAAASAYWSAACDVGQGGSVAADSAATAAAAAAEVSDDGFEMTQRGRWDYVIGLVGKPSAGKSTFFNARWGRQRYVLRCADGPETCSGACKIAQRDSPIRY